MRKIVFIARSRLEDFPRLRYIPKILIDLGYNVIIISPSDSVKGLSSPQLQKQTIVNTISSKSGIITKIYDWYRYRQQVKTQLFEIHIDSEDLIWYSSADSVLPLIFSRQVRKRKAVFQINELYDAYPVYKLLLKILLSRDSKVVVPEINRAILMKYWFNLRERPFILPNKAVDKDESIFIDASLESHLINIQNYKSQGFKIIIFQGMIEPRRDLSNLMRSLTTLDEKVMMIFMGKDFGMIEKYRQINPNIYVLPFQIAPNHLKITELADIGILYYDHSELNQIYCAPNKIWEYSAFGIPFISNELPGLNFATDKFKAGLQLDFENQYAVHDGVKRLIIDYEVYSANSKKMFNSIDMKSLISKVVQWVD